MPVVAYAGVVTFERAHSVVTKGDITHLSSLVKDHDQAQLIARSGGTSELWENAMRLRIGCPNCLYCAVAGLGCLVDGVADVRTSALQVGSNISSPLSRTINDYQSRQMCVHTFCDYDHRSRQLMSLYHRSEFRVTSLSCAKLLCWSSTFTEWNGS